MLETLQRSSLLFPAALSVYAQLVFQIAVSLFNSGAHLTVDVRRKILRAVNGSTVLQNLFEKFCLCPCTSRKRAARLEIIATDHFIHIKTPFLIILT
jgi:hypothetical protein